MTTGFTIELRVSSAVESKYWASFRAQCLRELSFIDDSAGLALELDRFLNDYLLQSEFSDDKDSSESEIIEEESEDDCKSRVTDAMAALDQTGKQRPTWQ